jgi:hypothetical protein
MLDSLRKVREFHMALNAKISEHPALLEGNFEQAFATEPVASEPEQNEPTQNVPVANELIDGARPNPVRPQSKPAPPRAGSRTACG